MYNHITRFFLWLFPIMKQAAIQVLAEEIHKLAYPNHPYRRPFNHNINYNRLRKVTQRGTDRTAKVDLDELRDYAEKDVDDTLRSQYGPRIKFGPLEGDAVTGSPNWFRERMDMEKPLQTGFHDVLMVAFDLKGKSAYQVHTWLADQLPTLSEESYDGEHVHLDDWWIANDERFNHDDRDSAVFVPKGNQEAARNKLRQYGLAF